MSVPILYIASRPFLPTSGGREKMILQSLEFLEIRYRVSVVIFKAKVESIDIRKYQARFPSFEFYVLDLPPVRLWIVQWMCAGRLLPFQVAMYMSKEAKRQIQAIMLKKQCELVIADMLRTSMLFPSDICTSLIELDDLLSSRYSQAKRENSSSRSLGTFRNRVPPFLRKIVESFAPAIFSYERWAIDRMERRSPNVHSAVTFVSHAEAKLLRERTGALNVFSIPPSIKATTIRNRRMPASVERKNLMFLGNMRTGANRMAVQYVLDTVLPALRSRGMDFCFYAVGQCPPDLIARYERPDTVFTGFVEDPEPLFARMHLHLAPMFGGTGIKTKVLESLARGIPTITTPDGAIGLNVESGKELFICRDAEDISSRCMELAMKSDLYWRMSEASAFFVSSHFDFQTNRNRYLEIISTCLLEAAHKRRFNQATSRWAPALETGSQSSGAIDNLRVEGDSDI
ncbi:glycosyltransferase [Caballeronia sp. LjRoot31]